MYLFFQTFPFFGVVPLVLNEEGKEVEGETEGYIVRIFYLMNFLLNICLWVLYILTYMYESQFGQNRKTRVFQQILEAFLHLIDNLSSVLKT